jgi:tetratricopeptide (TPR) repeat protein
MAISSRYDVFLLYAPRDGVWAARLRDELTAAGLSTVRVDADVHEPGPSWTSDLDRTMEQSMALVVLWSSTARESTLVREGLSRFVARSGARDRVLVIELEAETAESVRDLHPITTLTQETYSEGPDAVSTARWQAIVEQVRRIVRRDSQRKSLFTLTPSIAQLAGRLPDAVTAQALVRDLATTHAHYANSRARSFELAPEGANARRKMVDEWIADIAELMRPPANGELHGRQVILGLALADLPFGRRAWDSGLFAGIEAELKESFDSLLTDAGRAAWAALEPVALAGYAPDSVEGKDSLNVGPEVRALCTLIVAREVVPPLSIGLFGPWGSGKSFFMREMHDHIEKKTRRARATARARTEAEQPVPGPFCEDVVQIWFNAWHYIDANLWASLMARIWEELARQARVQDGEIDERYKELIRNLETSGVLLAAAARESLDADSRATEARAALDALALERADTGGKLGALRARDVVGELADDAQVRRAIGDVERAAGLREDTLAIDDLHRLAIDLHGLGRTRALWTLLRGQARWRRTLVVVGCVLLVIAAVALVANDWAQAAVAGILSALGLAAALARALSGILRPASSLIGTVDAAAERVRAAEAQRSAAIARDEAERRAELSRIEEHAAAARSQLASAEETKRDADRAIAELEAGRGMSRYIEERALSGDYERHLGLIAMIQRDLQSLSNLMRPDASSEPRHVDGELPKIDRIVLYIDDLDRCPPRLVVEVLQAVHLLLAYPLFVVVVGVDPRWLISSLSRHHVALMPPGPRAHAHDGTPTDWAAAPEDYLEKIFQIPFVLPPMQQHAYHQLVKDLLPVRVDEPDDKSGLDTSAASENVDLGADRRVDAPGLAEEYDEALEPGHVNLTIEAHELEFVKRLWRLIPSPRAAKRLVNIYRLLRAEIRPAALAAFGGQNAADMDTGDPPTGEYQAVLLLLGVMIGAPRDAHTVVTTMLGSTHKHLASVLDELDTQLSDSSTPALLRDAAAGLDDYPLKPFRDWIPRVTRFSFSLWQLAEAEETAKAAETLRP